jgi:hypothetical protein
MAKMMASIKPQTYIKQVLTIRLTLAINGVPTGANVNINDILLQAGDTATGWTPHVTELPWTAGITTTQT